MAPTWVTPGGSFQLVFQLLCAKGTHILQTKSKLAEESVQELINIIMTYEDPSLQGDESDDGGVEGTTNIGDKVTDGDLTAKDDADKYAGN